MGRLEDLVEELMQLLEDYIYYEESYHKRDDVKRLKAKIDEVRAYIDDDNPQLMGWVPAEPDGGRP